jgi:hypothetical protein
VKGTTQHIAKVSKHYKASTRPPTTLQLSPRVLKCDFSLPAPNAQLTSSRVLVAVFRVCGNGDYGVCYVSQHEEISTRAPRFRVAYQAPHTVAADGTHAVAEMDPMRSPQTEPTRSQRWIPCGRRRSPQTEPTRSLEMDPMRSPQTGARAGVPRPPPVERPSANGSSHSARRQ